jgi:hypothetical protein
MFVQIWAFLILAMLDCCLRSRAPTLGLVGRRLVSGQHLEGEDRFLQDVDEASLTMIGRSRRCYLKSDRKLAKMMIVETQG